MRTHTIILIVSLSLAAAACGSDSAETTTTVPPPPPTTLPVPTTAPPPTTTPATSEVWPLTGLPADVDVDPTVHPILVAKIDNTSNSRPQLGLGEADLVIEVLVEGGIPRLLSFFQSSMPTEVGPIRSAREVDPKVIAPFEPLFASSGGQSFVFSAIRDVATDVSHDQLGSTAYFRASDRPSLYDLILRTEDVVSLPDLTARPGDWLHFGPASSGEPATTISVSQSSYNQVEYRFSRADGGYQRFHGDTPHEVVTAESDEPVQIVADNVVVLFVTVLPTGRTDSSGSPVPDYQVIGSGEALVFRGGTATAVTWERETTDEFFTFFDPDGAEVLLGEGTTWIELTPNGRSVEWQ